ncbi:hypothetical protein MNBD_GAMMA21-3057 [hydrothermal vent metagenome]|uniref:Beta-lactamase n=1 Tax=hydrothermal vent metagenome TaxID=652676 RepID=A0A3B1A1T3_9ZZZZ
MSNLEDRFEEAYSLYQRKHYKESFEKYFLLAEEGHESCQSFVGWMYFSGEGVQRDLNKAKYWYEKAAKSGDSESLFYLGKIDYINEDYQEAFEKFSKSALNSYSPAIYRLGRLYQLGYGVSKNDKKAFDFFLKASNKGHLFARKQLAIYEMKGYRNFVNRFTGFFNYIYLFVIAIKLGSSDLDEKTLT